MNLKCFKAYDIRGKLGEELNEDIAYAIGRAYAEYLKPKSIVLGGDVRETSEELKMALARGIMDTGSNVIDIGLTGTEEVYFAVQHLGVDGGIEVTASHNPIDYNGMKPVRKGSKPISNDSGLLDIKNSAEIILKDISAIENSEEKKGEYCQLDNLEAYVDHLLSYIDTKKLAPLKLVVNSGNGAAGHVIDRIEEKFNENKVPVTFVKIQHEPDCNFPNGIPNPILPENQQVTSKAVLESSADFGIAWDGDFDRCFLFDQNGRFIEGYYIVGLLAEAFLQKKSGQKVIHDPRLVWNTQEIVSAAGGEAVQSKTGHAFIKERMRIEDAVYGGEMSAHHYFRDFGYCDSGMIPWLLVAELVSLSKKPLSTLVDERIEKYPSPGEINFKVTDTAETISRIEQIYLDDAHTVDRTDGISMEFESWRFNLRASNTEPVIRLNLETRGDKELMKEKLAELCKIIEER
ncbi:phosphomannomutase CpsG [Aliikangiella sp. G2MR2-5]|uniref:phosphomannomutase CpsG n=1 Tax=Aliikangiella sp. G2MR2-5 TaxID=2788943 RepID=UPI0018A9B90D|nr:phosphomannomutase CpsG [Aliikangiella sp. G2MR2-5]